jgi:hypothetical protein
LKFRIAKAKIGSIRDIRSSPDHPHGYISASCCTIQFLRRLSATSFLVPLLDTNSLHVSASLVTFRCTDVGKDTALHCIAAFLSIAIVSKPKPREIRNNIRNLINAFPGKSPVNTVQHVNNRGSCDFCRSDRRANKLAGWRSRGMCLL